MKWACMNGIQTNIVPGTASSCTGSHKWYPEMKIISDVINIKSRKQTSQKSTNSACLTFGFSRSTELRKSSLLFCCRLRMSHAIEQHVMGYEPAGAVFSSAASWVDQFWSTPAQCDRSCPESQWCQAPLWNVQRARRPTEVPWTDARVHAWLDSLRYNSNS